MKMRAPVAFLLIGLACASAGRPRQANEIDDSGTVPAYNIGRATPKQGVDPCSANTFYPIPTAWSTDGKGYTILSTTQSADKYCQLKGFAMSGTRRQQPRSYTGLGHDNPTIDLSTGQLIDDAGALWITAVECIPTGSCSCPPEPGTGNIGVGNTGGKSNIGKFNKGSGHAGNNNTNLVNVKGSYGNRNTGELWVGCDQKGFVNTKGVDLAYVGDRAKELGRNLIAVFATCADSKVSLPYKCPGTGVYPVANCSADFWRCECAGKDGVKVTCPSGMFFDRNVNACNFKDYNLECNPPTIICTTKGLIPTGKCKQNYWYCHSASCMRVNLSCANGLVFSGKTLTCEAPTNVPDCGTM